MSDNDDIEVDSDVSMATFNHLKMLFLLAGDLAELAAQLALATNKLASCAFLSDLKYSHRDPF